VDATVHAAGDRRGLVRSALTGDRLFVDETCVEVIGVERRYRAVDRYGQVIDALLSARRDASAARWFFTRALRMHKMEPSGVVADAVPVYPAVLDELIPAAWQHVEQYANTGRCRLRPALTPAPANALTPDPLRSTRGSPGTLSCRTAPQPHDSR
jgi:transposase-like protein